MACEKSTKTLSGKVGSKVVLRHFWHVWEVNKRSFHFQSLYFSFSQIVSSHASFSSKKFSLSYNFDEELFEKIEMKNNICFNFIITIIKSLEFFNFDEMEECCELCRFLN
jgi:hypothetical protein